jgi:hypothetical protein
MAYNGYLAPHADLIRRLDASGFSKFEIAQQLISMGIKGNCWSNDPGIIARSMSGMVGYVLRDGSYKCKAKTPKWQVWTPEMQEAEFQREYGQ